MNELNLINQFIEERYNEYNEATHRVYDPDSFGGYITTKGTAARIAGTKAFKKQHDVLNTDKKLRTMKDFNDAFDAQNDAVRLTAGTNKNDDQLKGTLKNAKRIYDTYKNYPKAFDNDPEVQSSKNKAKELLKDTLHLGKNKDEDIEKLRKIKRKYIPESFNDNDNDDAKLNIYEAFESGLITEFEKNELLNILNNICE